MVIVLALAVIGGGVGVAYKVLRPVVEGFLASNDYPGPGTGEVRVTIDAGSNGTAIAQTLADKDVVKSSKAFVDAAGNDPRSAGIQPGIYTMKKQMKASDALALLVDPKNRLITRVVIPEGLWASEIYAKLSTASGIPVAEYVAAAKQVDQLGLPPSAKGNIEGYLFPASYEFGSTSTALDQLKQMVAESTKRLEALGISPDRMERVVTVASLVEGEAKDRGRPLEGRPRRREPARGQDVARVRLDGQLHLQEAWRADPGHARQQQPVQHAPFPRTATRPHLQPGRERAPRRPPARWPVRGSTS